MNLKRRLLVQLASLFSLLGLQGCGLNPLSPVFDSALKNTDSAPVAEFKPGRWAFIFEPGPEAVRKEETVKKIDRFWADFRVNKERLAWNSDPKIDRSFVTDWFSRHVHSFDPRLEWEAGGNKNGGSDLDISAAENIDLMPLLTTIVERAGNIPGWHFGCFRQPTPSDLVEQTYKARVRKDLPPFRALVKCNKSSGIDVTISSPNFVGTDRAEDLATAIVLSEIVLGEEAAEKWLNQFSTVQESLANVEPFDFTKEANNFSKSFEEQKASITSKRPKKSRWQIKYPDRVVLLTASKAAFKDSDKYERYRFSWMSPDAELAQAMSHSSRFFSEHFSALNEKFAYLHVISKPGDDIDNRRPDIEDALDKLLREKQLGSVVATGRGKPESYYFDLCLTDVEKAVPVLKNFCVAQKLPAKTWLRFYDLYWRNEWVKMLPSTPELKNPQDMW